MLHVNRTRVVALTFVAYGIEVWMRHVEGEWTVVRSSSELRAALWLEVESVRNKIDDDNLNENEEPFLSIETARNVFDNETLILFFTTEWDDDEPPATFAWQGRNNTWGDFAATASLDDPDEQRMSGNGGVENRPLKLGRPDAVAQGWNRRFSKVKGTQTGRPSCQKILPKGVDTTQNVAKLDHILMRLSLSCEKLLLFEHLCTTFPLGGL